MFETTYRLMQCGVMYDAIYTVDGRSCVIKKAADDNRLGIVTCEFRDGTIVRRHHAFFDILKPSKQQTFRAR